MTPAAQGLLSAAGSFWAYCLLVVITRDMHHAWRDSRVVWGAGRAWPEQAYIALPWWAGGGDGGLGLGKACHIPPEPWPAVGALPPSARAPRRSEQWCLPASRSEQRVELKRLDALVTHLGVEAVRVGAAGLVASQVGIPVRVMVFQGQALLNPRVARSAGTWECVVRPTSGPDERLASPRNVTVEYEKPGGAVYALVALDWDACAMTYLLQHM